MGGTAGALVNGGASSVTITNSFSFPTAGYRLNLVGGEPVAGAPGTIFTGSFPLSAGLTALLTSIDPADVTEISGVIGGAGASLANGDNGTLELGGANTYDGYTTISNPAALIIIGSGSLGSGSYSGLITNNSTFVYDSSAAQTLAGSISGTGSLLQAGSGILTLTASNTYTGSTTVSNGSMLVLGSGRFHRQFRCQCVGRLDAG